MKYAKKLEIDFKWQGLDKCRRVVGRHGVRKNFPGFGVTRHHVSLKELNRLKQLLPASLRGFVATAALSEIQLLAPHIHYEEGCVINFYQETGGETTTFWEGEIAPDSTDILDNGNSYYNVDVSKIYPVESFVAQPGDIWALDSLQAHSVSKPDLTAPTGMKFFESGFSPRRIVQVYMTCPFYKVAHAFDT